MINTTQGERLFERISDACKRARSETAHVIPKNSLVNKPEDAHYAIPADREGFFRPLRQSGWK